MRDESERDYEIEKKSRICRKESYSNSNREKMERKGTKGEEKEDSIKKVGKEIRKDRKW